jgi:putative transposase
VTKDSDDGQKKKKEYVSLDPGVRTFQTLYDSEGSAINICSESDEIYRLCKRQDRLYREIANLCLKNYSDDKLKKSFKYKRRKLKRKIRVIEWKIQNKIKDLHCKTANYLVDNYQQILLPKFQTQQMVRRFQKRYGTPSSSSATPTNSASSSSTQSDTAPSSNTYNRKIGRKTVRTMLRLSHYRFQIMLKHKAKLDGDCMVHSVSEEYSSKTCGHCGKIYEGLNGQKWFYCPTCCQFSIDRDVNGARNIFLMNAKRLVVIHINH